MCNYKILGEGIFHYEDGLIDVRNWHAQEGSGRRIDFIKSVLDYIWERALENEEKASFPALDGTLEPMEGK